MRMEAPHVVPDDVYHFEVALFELIPFKVFGPLPIVCRAEVVALKGSPELSWPTGQGHIRYPGEELAAGLFLGMELGAGGLRRFQIHAGLVQGIRPMPCWKVGLDLSPDVVPDLEEVRMAKR